MKFDSPSRNNDSTSSLDVFSEPQTDRMTVHVVWEIGLLLLGGGVLFALTQSSEGPFAEGSWNGFIAALVPVVLLAAAVSISLRVGAVNLAVGPIALVSAWLFVDASASGAATALGMGMGVACFAGIVLATFCGWLRVPGWAASGAAGGAIVLWASSAGDPAAFMLSELAPTGVLMALAGAAGLSIFLGLVGAISGVRGRLAPIRDTPAGERHGRGGLVFFGLLLSSVLAGGAGVIAAWTAVPEGGAAGLPDPVLLSVMAVGAALLGGTSLMGRRGGVCGTVFASVLVLALMWLAPSRGWDINDSWIPLGAIVAGFLVTRLIEAMNTADDAALPPSGKAGSLDDLREDDPPGDSPNTELIEGYDDDFANVGNGRDPWAGGNPGQPKDPFSTGAFDDLRHQPAAGDGFTTQTRGGERRHGF